MKKEVDITSEKELDSSLDAIYARAKTKKSAKKEAKEEAKLVEKEKKKSSKYREDGTKKSKKERRQEQMDAFNKAYGNIMGDELDVTPVKKDKKRYKRWIEESDIEFEERDIKKKKKKRDYDKEFAPELKQLNSLVVEQKNFTKALMGKFNSTIQGPVTKASVDLAATINASRSNTLNCLREIGSLKKARADLYYKQLKANEEGGGVKEEDGNLDLIGSSIAASLFDQPLTTMPPQPEPQQPTPQANPFVQEPQNLAPVVPVQAEQMAEAVEFDPSSWTGGPDISDTYTAFESIPHSTVCEWDKQNNRARFKAVRDDTGEELVGCPVPEVDIKRLKFNEEEMTVKSEFNDVYRLDILDGDSV
ncbi:MAG: hypothetical protein HDQ88_07345 [Clostridia bacterium]|nr:hypothetical protein [Clostridia bacterium]